MSGYAREIVVHRGNNHDGMCVSFVGDGECYTFLVYSNIEDQDTVDAAIEMATQFEAATGLRWRVHDESMGPLELTHG